MLLFNGKIAAGALRVPGAESIAVAHAIRGQWLACADERGVEIKTVPFFVFSEGRSTFSQAALVTVGRGTVENGRQN